MEELFILYFSNRTLADELMKALSVTFEQVANSVGFTLVITEKTRFWFILDLDLDVFPQERHFFFESIGCFKLLDLVTVKSGKYTYPLRKEASFIYCGPEIIHREGYKIQHVIPLTPAPSIPLTVEHRDFLFEVNEAKEEGLLNFEPWEGETLMDKPKYSYQRHLFMVDEETVGSFYQMGEIFSFTENGIFFPKCIFFKEKVSKVKEELKKLKEIQ